MSASVRVSAETLAERGARATGALCEALGLGHLSSQDLKMFAIALAEQATSEALRNREFAQNVRSAFQELRAQRPSLRKQGAKKEEPEPLVAVGPLDPSLLTPHGRLDPYALYRAYGDDQTRRLLSNKAMEDLKRSVAIVQARNPGTKPSDARIKARLVDYIMTHVTN